MTSCSPGVLRMKRGLITVLFLIAVSACDRVEEPTAPELQPSSLVAQQTQVVQGGDEQLGLISTDRLTLALDVKRGPGLGSPVQITVSGTANLAFAAGQMRITLPELEHAKATGFGRDYRVQIGVPLARAGQWDFGPTNRGRSFTRTTSASIPAAGYYRVIADMEAHPAEVEFGLINNGARVVAWLLVTEGGVTVTPDFDRSAIPDGMRGGAGPFVAKRRRAREAGFFPSFSSLFSAFKPTPVVDPIYVRTTYFDGTSSVLAPFATLHTELWDAQFEELLSVEVEPAGANAIVELGCPLSFEEYRELEWELTGSQARDLDRHGTGPNLEIGDCGDTISHSVPQQNYSAYMALQDTAIARIDSGLGKVRNVMPFKMLTNGCVRFPVANADCYEPISDRLELRTANFVLSSSRRTWLAAHEYSHALHHKTLGGLPEVSGCSEHVPGAATTYSCALVEGFADYAGTVGSQFNPYVQGNDWETFSCASPAPKDEGCFAALLHDIVDGTSESGDAIDYTGSFAAGTLGACEVKRGSWQAIGGTDDYVWCLEKRVDATVHGIEFSSSAPTDARRSGVGDPSGFNADSVRTTWRSIY